MDGSLHPAGSHRPPFRSLQRALLLLALALAGVACVPTTSASAATTVPTGMLGMNDWTSPSDQMLANVSRAGVRRWRAAMFWAYVEPTRGQRNWSEYDLLVASAARRGVSLLFVMASCPNWACSELSGPPTTQDGLGAERAFLRAAVARYGTSGSFWSSHPELPRRPVTDWQVWNEVNAKEFWKPTPNATDYARFLRDNAAVIRSADPRATVVLSGLTEFGQVPVADFLKLLYLQPGFRSSFDVVAVHAYEPNTARVADLLDRTRRVMTDNGDSRKQLWVTEMGWGTTSSALRTPYSEGDQATLMRESLDLLIGCRSRWNLGRAYWFAYNDHRPGPGETDYAGNHTGLFDLAGRPKAAWSTLQGFREGAQRPRAGCAASASPATRAPQTRIKVRKRLRGARRARAKLIASTRGARFECRLARTRRARKGRAAMRKSGRWRRCGKRYRSPKLRRGYRYTLRVRAIGMGGAADRSPAKVKLRLRKSRRGRVFVAARVRR